MKSHPHSAKKAIPTSGVTDITPLPKKPLKAAPTPEKEHSGAHSSGTAPTREEIRSASRRVMPSRQSNKPVERSGQHRKHHGGQPKGKKQD